MPRKLNLSKSRRRTLRTVAFADVMERRHTIAKDEYEKLNKAHEDYDAAQARLVNIIEEDIVAFFGDAAHTIFEKAIVSGPEPWVRIELAREFQEEKADHKAFFDIHSNSMKWSPGGQLNNKLHHNRYSPGLDGHSDYADEVATKVVKEWVEGGESPTLTPAHLALMTLMDTRPLHESHRRSACYLIPDTDETNEAFRRRRNAVTRASQAQGAVIDKLFDVIMAYFQMIEACDNLEQLATYWPEAEDHRDKLVPTSTGSFIPTSSLKAAEEIIKLDMKSKGK